MCIKSEPNPAGGIDVQYILCDPATVVSNLSNLGVLRECALIFIKCTQSANWSEWVAGNEYCSCV